MTVFIQRGASHEGGASFGGSGQHQSVRRRDANGCQERPLLRLITRVVFTSLSQAPPPSSRKLYPTPDDQQDLAVRLACKRLLPRRRGTPGSPHGQRPPGGEDGTLALNPLENRGRSVSERASRQAIELIEINIHDWTRGQPEHLAACASISRRLQRAAGVSWAVGVVLQSGRGHMVFTRRGGHYASRCHYHCLTRTLPSKAARFLPSLSTNAAAIPHGPAPFRLRPQAGTNGGWCREPRQPPLSTPDLLHHH